VRKRKEAKKNSGNDIKARSLPEILKSQCPITFFFYAKKNSGNDIKARRLPEILKSQCPITFVFFYTKALITD
jgi:preprotein translocase subunit SecB